MEIGDLLFLTVVTTGATLVLLGLASHRHALVPGLRNVLGPPLAALHRGVSNAALAIFEGLRQARPWHLAAWAFAMVLLFSCLSREARNAGLPLVLLTGGAAIAFLLAWSREFLFLMSLRDDDLPGRFDKLVWVVVLIGLAPLGLFLFRAHRLAHWPEPKPKPAPEAAHELV